MFKCPVLSVMVSITKRIGRVKHDLISISIVTKSLHCHFCQMLMTMKMIIMIMIEIIIIMIIMIMIMILIVILVLILIQIMMPVIK